MARPGTLAVAISRKWKTRIEDERLGHRLVFKGFVSDPEEVLQSAFALVRPSRENDPWGRDVIEATTFGVPVLATGSFGGVVEHGVTGFLFDPFDARAMAEKLAELLHLEETWGAISLTAGAAARICSAVSVRYRR